MGQGTVRDEALDDIGIHAVEPEYDHATVRVAWTASGPDGQQDEREAEHGRRCVRHRRESPRGKLRASGRSRQPRRAEGSLIARLRSHRSRVVEGARATRWWQGALLLVGAALFVFLIAEIGLGAIESSFRTLSWRESS